MTNAAEKVIHKAGGLTSRVPLPVRIGFGIGDFGFLLVWQGTSLFLLYFYTDVLGIPATIAGLIYFAAMVWDAVTDPIIAALADRTQTRYGKYRPWLLFGAAPFAICYPLAFSGAPAIWPFGIAAWALITHVALRTSYTIVSMPFNSLQARLTNDAHERSILAGFRMIGAALGGLTVVVVTPMLVTALGEAREAEAYFLAACIAGAFAFCALLYCFFSMKEPDDAYVPPQSSFWTDLKSVGAMFSKNPPLLRVFGIIIVATICIGMFGQSMLYYFKYDVGRPDLTMIALLLPAVLMIFTVPIWIWYSGKTSKKTSLVTGVSIALIGYLLFFLNFNDNILLALSAISLTGIGTTSVAVMFWAMLPDTVEYGEAKTGFRAEAKTFGFATFAQKAAVGINAVIFGALLSVAGFEANVDQSEQTLIGMKAIMALIPAFGCVAMIWLMRGYRLDRKAHQELVAEIKARHGQSSAAL